MTGTELGLALAYSTLLAALSPRHVHNDFQPSNTFYFSQGTVPVALAVNGTHIAIGLAQKSSLTFFDYNKTGRAALVACVTDCASDGGMARGNIYYKHDGPCIVRVSRSGQVGFVEKSPPGNPWRRGLEFETHAPAYCLAYKSHNCIFLGSENDTIGCYAEYGPKQDKKIYKGDASGNVNVLEIVDNTMLSGNNNGQVALIDIESGARMLLGEHAGHTVTSFAKHDTLLYSGGSDSLVKMWDVRLKKALHAEIKIKSPVTAMISLPNGYLAVGSSDDNASINIFDMGTVAQKPVTTVHAGNGVIPARVTALAVMDDGFTSASSDGVIKVWK